MDGNRVEGQGTGRGNGGDIERRKDGEWRGKEVVPLIFQNVVAPLTEGSTCQQSRAVC